MPTWAWVIIVIVAYWAGFWTCALFANTRMAKADARLRVLAKAASPLVEIQYGHTERGALLDGYYHVPCKALEVLEEALELTGAKP